MKIIFAIAFWCCFILFGVMLTSAQTAPDARPIVDDSRETPDKKLHPNLPTLYIVGDSTLKSNPPMRGWGQELAQFFDQSKLNVVNRAIGGRSSRTFQNEGRWDKVLAELKSGDFVIIQFGHNDVGKFDDPAAKERPSLHGENEETAEVAKKDGSKETVHTFGWYLRKYGIDARKKGARVIFCSMVPHQDWENSKIVRKESATFVKWTANAARATGAAFIDLNEAIALEFERRGATPVASLFSDKRTHSTAAGALLNAQIVIAGMRALKNPNFNKYFSSRGKNVKKLSAHVVGASRK